jgi:adenylyl-sulfate kinase
MSPDKNLTRTHSLVSASDRARILRQQSAVLWFTGLSGSGKSTLAYALERRLVEMGHLTFALDGDNLRLGLCNDLGFSKEDRSENMRRVGELASLLATTGMLILTSFISPYRADRDAIRAKLGETFIEVHLDVPVEVCESRDPKGLYLQARAGKIANFTGISAPYEPPLTPEIRVDTAAHDLEECVTQIVRYLESKGLLREALAQDEVAQGQPQ